MNFLRQSTASQSRSIGQFVDDTDFKTPETSLTIASTDIKLIANGGASANKTPAVERTARTGTMASHTTRLTRQR